MVAIPAFCPLCKSIFPFKGIHLSPGAKATNVTMSGLLTTCPVCGFKEAKVSDGIFNLTNEAVEIVSAPEFTRAMLQALSSIAKKAAAGEISKQEAVEEAAAISPAFAKALDRGLSHGMAAAALFVSILSYQLQLDGNRSSDDAVQKFLGAVTEQTYVLKNIERRLTKAKSVSKAALKKGPRTFDQGDKSERKIKDARRRASKKRRTEFGGSRTH